MIIFDFYKFHLPLNYLTGLLKNCKNIAWFLILMTGNLANFVKYFDHFLCFIDDFEVGHSFYQVMNLNYFNNSYFSQ